MSNAEFLTVRTATTTGTLAALPRILLIVSREAVSGFTPDPQSGLIKINSTDLTAFETANSTSVSLIDNLRLAFGQTYFYPYVFILSVPSGVTSADLDKANIRPRDWSIMTYADQYNGGGNGGDTYPYFVDLEIILAWDPLTKNKVCVFTYSMDEGDDLPAKLELGGTVNSYGGFKTIVSDETTTINSETVYRNIAAAWVSYCINAAISRSWGSLSDAHDFALLTGDTFSQTTRSAIANNSLGQYNGAKDQGGALFVYDTQMNSDQNPPVTDMIETVLAGQYIKDYEYVYVRNSLQQAGESGLPNDDAGIQRLLGLTRAALLNCFGLNLILSQSDGSPDFSAYALTADQVTAIDPTWINTGVWPAGVVKARVRRFGSAKYVTIDFTFP